MKTTGISTVLEPGDVNDLLEVWERRLADRRTKRIALDEEIASLELKIADHKLKLQSGDLFEPKANPSLLDVALNGLQKGLDAALNGDRSPRGRNLEMVKEFLRVNPDKTTKEISECTGVGYTSVDAILKRYGVYFERDESQKRWRFKEIKFK